MRVTYLNTWDQLISRVDHKKDEALKKYGRVCLPTIIDF